MLTNNKCAFTPYYLLLLLSCLPQQNILTGLFILDSSFVDFESLCLHLAEIVAKYFLPHMFLYLFHLLTVLRFPFRTHAF